MPDTELSVFQCCDCAAPMATSDTCSSCGRDYGKDDGRPVLFPSTDRNFSMTLSLSSLDPTRIPVDKVFTVPETTGQRGTDVYHLDRAHLKIFEQLPKGSRVMECGCGGGQMRGWLKDMGHSYVGTDISNTRVFEWLQEFGGADVLCDAHALPFRENSFDVVYASAVWEHLAFPQFAAAEAFRVLKPGGYFLGSASFLEPWHDESYYHMTPNGVYAMLSMAEFEPEHIWPEKAWPGFEAMFAMGNAATKPISKFGKALNGYYMLPKRLKMRSQLGRWPTETELFETRAKMSGALAWIARKPEGGSN